jgi:hypothetical protein
MPAPKKRLGKGSQRLKFKDVSPKAEKEEQEMLNKKGYGGKMKKKPVAMKGGGILGALGGGKCRGMGAATRGGNYMRDG